MRRPGSARVPGNSSARPACGAAVRPAAPHGRRRYRRTDSAAAPAPRRPAARPGASGPVADARPAHARCRPVRRPAAALWISAPRFPPALPALGHVPPGRQAARGRAPAIAPASFPQAPGLRAAQPRRRVRRPPVAGCASAPAASRAIRFRVRPARRRRLPASGNPVRPGLRRVRPAGGAVRPASARRAGAVPAGVAVRCSG
ncbi:hypothetical protein D9M71_222310 [compost metagenome]